jgi:hypothetical protein
MEASGTTPKKTLFFIPDISGFTQFISDRDFQHQQYIIAELLEVLIETNPLNLKVNEVEGDAILFFQTGDAPPLRDLMDQSEKMYLAFHNHLKKYGVSRLCNCNTCKSASRLTLKFIAHHGEGAFHKIKDREKIFGTDVILVHRLLKNSIPDREYLLVTDSIPSNTARPSPTEIDWKSGSETYDSGHISFRYFPLDSWYDKVPEPVLPEPTIYRVKQPLSHSVDIAAPVEIVYDSLIDLSQRKHYMVGLKGLSVKDAGHNRLNRICTTFQCSMEHEKCTFETSGVEITDNGVSFSETFKEHPITFDYVLQRHHDHTSLFLKIHPALKIPKKWLFDLIMKRMINNDSKRTLKNLKAYCESKVIIENLEH